VRDLPRDRAVIAATQRSSPAFAVGGVVETFGCIACGAECVVRPSAAPRGICPDCCTDHDYEYDRGDRRFYCDHCGMEPPADWYDVGEP
jgi:hypothetical protein